MDTDALATLSDFTVDYQPELHGDIEGLRGAVVDADAIIVRNRTMVDVALLDRATALKAVGRLGVGLDNIDMDACGQRNIAVLPATGANALSVAEYVISAAMALMRAAFWANEAMLAGNWPRGTLSAGGELSGKTLGLVGFGGTAQAVAERADSLGMSILAYDPHRPADDLAWGKVRRAAQLGDILGVDVLSLHVPLTTETRMLIDSDALARMKPTAILVNTARGGILDETAVVSALNAGQLGGAALDVFETEPLSADAAQKFAGARNLILTPHIAGVTAESNVRVSAVTADNVRRALS
ncbi:MAG: hydroxyacid dehydrogenase [Pseudomonadota bacterium]